MIAEDAGIIKVEGGNLSLDGFGKFSVSKRDARMGAIHLLGESFKIKAKKVTKFKASEELIVKSRSILLEPGLFL